MLTALGYSGPVLLETSLHSIRAIKWVHGLHGHPESVGGSELDDELSFSISTTTDDLRRRRDGVLMEVLRQVFFSVNLPEFVEPPIALEQWITNGYAFNKWEIPETLRL
jgi:hypothetical protein